MKRVLILSPILFATVLITLTIIKYDFLLSLGWHPLKDPTFDWPSGLALGEYGFIMTATFIVSGLLITALALRLKTDLPPAATSQTGSTLLALSGLALAGLAFTTDPTIRMLSATTWHGRLHDLSYVLLGFTLLPSMILLGFAFQKMKSWKLFSFYTWVTVVVAIPAFIFKGAAFYAFMIAVLLWMESLAWKLNRAGESNPTNRSKSL